MRAFCVARTIKTDDKIPPTRSRYEGKKYPKTAPSAVKYAQSLILNRVRQNEIGVLSSPPLVELSYKHGENLSLTLYTHLMRFSHKDKPIVYPCGKK